MKLVKKTLLSTLCLGAFATAAVTAQAADTVKLRLADSFPTGHYIPDAMTKPFMEAVTEQTDGAVEFEYYPAEQMGKSKDMLSLTQSGVVDIAYVAPAFVSDKMPLGVVAELPGGFTESCEGTQAYWKLAQEGGLLHEKEFGPLGVKVLFTLVLPPYQIFLGKDQLTGLDAIDGLKIRTSGGAKEIATRKLKATPVQMATPEVYEALARGTIDGMLFPYSSILSYDLQTLVKTASVGENFGSFIVNYVISDNSWNKLTEEQQEVLTKVGHKMTEEACKVSQRLEVEDMETIKEEGANIVEFSSEDKEKIAQLMEDVGTEWAEALDKRGKAGSEVLEAFQNALAENE